MKIAGWLFFCLSSPLLCHAAGGRALVRLCQRAGVAAETVRLSDFFPPESPAELREEAAGIELGRSPLLGSAHSFSREEILQALGGHDNLVRQLSIPDGITVSRVGSPIAVDRVRSAIATYMNAGSTNAELNERLTLMGDPQATDEKPALKVTRAEREPWRGGLRFTVACMDKKQCGAFFATMPEPKQSTIEIRRPVAGEISKPAILAGKPAMLELQNGTVHISLQVICLDRGAVGQIVRVRDARGKKIFQARVVGDGKVQAGL